MIPRLPICFPLKLVVIVEEFLILIYISCPVIPQSILIIEAKVAKAYAN
jgi:hypothetical protein